MGFVNLPGNWRQMWWVCPSRTCRVRIPRVGVSANQGRRSDSRIVTGIRCRLGFQTDTMRRTSPVLDLEPFIREKSLISDKGGGRGHWQTHLSKDNKNTRGVQGKSR